MELKNRLAAAIERRNMTMKEAAQLADVPYRSLQNYLSGKQQPGTEAIVNICSGLGIDPNWLLLGGDQEEPETGYAMFSEAFGFLESAVIGSSLDVAAAIIDEFRLKGIKVDLESRAMGAISQVLIERDRRLVIEVLQRFQVNRDEFIEAIRIASQLGMPEEYTALRRVHGSPVPEEK